MYYIVFTLKGLSINSHLNRHIFKRNEKRVSPQSDADYRNTLFVIIVLILNEGKSR